MDTKDIVEIQQLMALYCHAVDAPDQSMFPQVFTEDAVFVAGSTGWGDITGRAAIAAWFARGKPPHPPAHNVFSIHVSEADGETRVRAKWMNIDWRTGSPFAGDYNNVVVRTPEGWRIKRVSFLIRYPLDYAGTGPGRMT